MRKAKAMCLLALFILACFAVGAQAKTTIEIWPVWGQASADLVKEALIPYLEKNPHIEIKAVPSGQGVGQRDKLFTMMAAGTPPDIVFMVSPIAEMAVQGALEPLDRLVANSKYIRPQDYPPGMLDIFKYDGSIYAIPGIEVGPWLGMAINVDFMEEAGVPGKSPATLDELVKVARKTTRMNGDKVERLGFAPLTGMGQSYFPETWPFLYNIKLYDPATRTVNINTPAMHELVNYLRSFHDAVPATSVEAFTKANGGSWWSGMLGGLVGMQIQGYWTPGRFLVSEAAQKWRWNFDWAPNKLGDKFQVLGGWGMVIPKGSRNVEEAFKIIEYLITPEPSKLFYARNGWLNGNLASMRQLDVSDNAGIQWYISTLTMANRTWVPEYNPISRDMRSLLVPRIWQILRGQASPDQALTDAQAALQSLLDDVFKK